MAKSSKASLLHLSIRWLIRVSLILLLLIVMLAMLFLIRASFVSTDHLYQTKPISQEVEMQLTRLGNIVNRSAEIGRLDLYTDYTEIYGEGIEWNFGFYVFYALCLEELAKQDPSRMHYAIDQIDLCTRLMLRSQLTRVMKKFQKYSVQRLMIIPLL